MNDGGTLLVRVSRGGVSTIDQLAAIPEEEIWLAKQKSARTRRAYRLDVRHFMRDARHHHHRRAAPGRSRAVIAWERISAKTRRRAFDHPPPARGAVQPVQASGAARRRDAKSGRARWSGRRSIATKAPRWRSRKRRRARCSTRRRATRSPVCATAPFCRSACRSDSAAPKSPRSRSATCTRTGASMRCACMRKGGRREALAINPQAAQRIRAYLDVAGHGDDSRRADVPAARGNGKPLDAERRRMDPDAIDRMVRKYAGEIGLARGYSAHSMRATFITTALENGAQLEDVQKAAGHRDPSTTKLYDRRGYNPEKAASFFATY